MLWLQMTLGATIRGSPIGMWHISPICKGIGIALLIAHGVSNLNYPFLYRLVTAIVYPFRSQPCTPPSPLVGS